MLPDDDDALAQRQTNGAILLDHLSTTLLTLATPPRAPKPRGKRKPTPRPTPQSAPLHETANPTDLADSLAYASTAIFETLPAPLQSLSPASFQQQRALDRWTPPLPPTLLDSLTAPLPTDAVEILDACILALQPVDQPHALSAQRVLEEALTSYLTALTEPPSAEPIVHQRVAKADSCELCERSWIPLTAHHLIPRSTHAKVIKRGWHVPERVNDVAWICRACHNFVHDMASNEELAREWFELERIREREDVQRWVSWVGRVRWKKT